MQHQIYVYSQLILTYQINVGVLVQFHGLQNITFIYNPR